MIPTITIFSACVILLLIPQKTRQGAKNVLSFCFVPFFSISLTLFLNGYLVHIGAIKASTTTSAMACYFFVGLPAALVAAAWAAPKGGEEK